MKREMGISASWNSLMNRVWLDNALNVASEELYYLTDQIRTSRAESVEMLTSLSRDLDQQALLFAQWESNLRTIDKLCTELALVRQQFECELAVLKG